MRAKFKEMPNAYDIIDHLNKRIQDELTIINKEKKSSIKWWSDLRYARYDITRFVLMQQLRELSVLYKEVERAEQLELAAGGNYEDQPF